MYEHGDFKQELKDFLAEKRQAAKSAAILADEWCQTINADFVNVYHSTNSNMFIECVTKGCQMLLNARDHSWYEVNVEITPNNSGSAIGVISTRGFKGNRNKHKFIVEDFEHLYSLIDEQEGLIGRYLVELSENTK